jgi:hypothetical protein
MAPPSSAFFKLLALFTMLTVLTAIMVRAAPSQGAAGMARAIDDKRALIRVRNQSKYHRHLVIIGDSNEP